MVGEEPMQLRKAFGPVHGLADRHVRIVRRCHALRVIEGDQGFNSGNAVSTTKPVGESLDRRSTTRRFFVCTGRSPRSNALRVSTCPTLSSAVAWMGGSRNSG